MIGDRCKELFQANPQTKIKKKRLSIKLENMLLHNTSAHADTCRVLSSRIRTEVGILPTFATSAPLCATEQNPRDPEEKRFKINK